jgi:hypothetical protein
VSAEFDVVNSQGIPVTAAVAFGKGINLINRNVIPD